MTINNFKDLFVVLLSDIYQVENLILTELPKLGTLVHSDELKTAIHDHLKETKEQVRRLDKIFKLMGEQPYQVDWSSNTKNFFAGYTKFIDKLEQPSYICDAAIIAILQRVEHLEIAIYGTLKEFAEVLDRDEIKELLNQTLKEEAESDDLLSKIAKGKWFTTGINEEALKH